MNNFPHGAHGYPTWFYLPSSFRTFSAMVRTAQRLRALCNLPTTFQTLMD